MSLEVQQWEACTIVMRCPCDQQVKHRNTENSYKIRAHVQKKTTAGYATDFVSVPMLYVRLNMYIYQLTVKIQLKHHYLVFLP